MIALFLFSAREIYLLGSQIATIRTGGSGDDEGKKLDESGFLVYRQNVGYSNLCGGGKTKDSPEAEG